MPDDESAGRTRAGLLRPTGRGVVVLVVTIALWALGALSGLVAALDVAAALLVVLVLSAVTTLLCGIGLRLERRIEDPRVTAPGTARVSLSLAPDALLSRFPLGSGVVRCAMPEALGGSGELTLRPQVPHLIAVRRRGEHRLGPCTVRVQDVFGLFRISRTQELPGTVIGLPRVERLDPAAMQRARLAHDGTLGAGAGQGIGEIGPLARPYVPGDDLRRIHWRASARADRLMTREDEPLEAETAVIVLDDRRDGPARPGLEDRLVSATATFGAMLRETGWSVRVLDARGDEIVHAAAADRSATIGTRSARGSVLAQESGASGDHHALDALARLEFRDASPASALGLPAGGVTTGDVALALVLLPGAPGAAGAADRAGAAGGAGAQRGRLRALAPLAGRAGRRVAVILDEAADPTAAMGPDPRAHGAGAVTAPRVADVPGLPGGTWTVVQAEAAAPLSSIVDALAQGSEVPA